jgi:hypothetical protein
MCCRKLPGVSAQNAQFYGKSEDADVETMATGFGALNSKRQGVEQRTSGRRIANVRALHSKRQRVTHQTTTHLPTSRCSPTLSRWTRQHTRVNALLPTSMRSLYDRIRSPLTSERITRRRRAVGSQLEKEKTRVLWSTHTSGLNFSQKEIGARRRVAYLNLLRCVAEGSDVASSSCNFGTHETQRRGPKVPNYQMIFLPWKLVSQLETYPQKRYIATYRFSGT